MPNPVVDPTPGPDPGPAGLMLFPACHSGSPVRVVLVDGRLHLACQQCYQRIAEIAFVRHAEPEETWPGPYIRPAGVSPGAEKEHERERACFEEGAKTLARHLKMRVERLEGEFPFGRGPLLDFLEDAWAQFQGINKP